MELDVFDYKRIFTTYPLPKKYSNPNTVIKIVELFGSHEFQILAVNPNYPPLTFDTEKKKWRVLKHEPLST